MALEIINDSAMEMAYLVGQMNFPGHSLTIMVKGVYDLQPDEVVSLAAEQYFPTGDEYYDDDSDGLGGPRYPSDFCYFKPKADLLLVGTCHAPAQKEVTEQLVSFSVGEFSKSLKVIGQKFWESQILDQQENSPATYSQIELRYDNAYGGPGYPDNPVGKGRAEQLSPEGLTRKLFPNIIHEWEPTHSFLKNLSPAGFGPLNIAWPMRHGYIGSYKGNYLQTRWPWFADNFDFHYFNAAPADQQIAGYLTGDEKLTITNIHAEHRNFSTTLPGLRCRCFTSIITPGSSKEKEPIFSEVAMKLDTLWVDMDATKLILTWRGWTEISDEDFPELQNIFIITEPLTEPAKSGIHYQKLLTRRLAEQNAEYEPEEEPTELKTRPEPEDIDKEVAKAQAAMDERLKQAGIDPDNPPLPSTEDIAREKELLATMGFPVKEAEPEEKLTAESFMAAFHGGQQFNEVVVEDLDLSDQDLTEVNFTNSVLQNINLTGANLSGAKLSGTTFLQVELNGANLKQANLANADLTGQSLRAVNLAQADLSGAILEKVNMSKANLQQVTGQQCYLAQANLADCNFQESDFTGADFSQCQLKQADFRQAILAEAIMEGVFAPGIRLDHADLFQLRASESSDFTGGSFQQSLGKESIWEGANLHGTNFSYCQMEGADFSQANLTKANLIAANMKYARFTKANLEKSRANSMNLFMGSLKKANLTLADFGGANLYAVEFLGAIIDQTNFAQANLKMSKLA